MMLVWCGGYRTPAQPPRDLTLMTSHHDDPDQPSSEEIDEEIYNHIMRSRGLDPTELPYAWFREIEENRRRATATRRVWGRQAVLGVDDSPDILRGLVSDRREDFAVRLVDGRAALFDFLKSWFLRPPTGDQEVGA